MAQQTANREYFGIFNSWDCIDEDIRQETRKMLAECNNMAEQDITDDWITDSIMAGLEDEKMNLDKEADGCIIAFCSVGRWNGRSTGSMIIGSNIADILSSYYGGDNCEYYADRYNVRARASHHDGTNYILFRLAENEEQADRLQEALYDGTISTEQEFMKRTKSIRPYIAKIYGWRQFGRQKRS